MRYIKYNQNPCDKLVGDCTVRALATLLGRHWERIYVSLCLLGYDMCDMPSSKSVVSEYLKQEGFERHIIPENCMGCTVEEFARRNNHGTYLLATDTHVVPVIDGYYIDSWNSGNEIPIYYWVKGVK